MKLSDEISVLKGIGKKRAEVLKRNGLETVRDLLDFFPIKYEDKTEILPLNSTEETHSVLVEIDGKSKIQYRGYRNSVLFVPVKDDYGNKAKIVFFNQPYLISKFIPGKKFYFFGKVHEKKGQLRMFNPKFASEEESEAFLTIEPVYKKLEGVPQKTVQSSIKTLLDSFELRESIPEKYKEKFNLISINEMYRFLHNPKSAFEIKRAHYRLKFNEGLKINAGIFSSQNVPEFTDIRIKDSGITENFIKSLPFELTESQKEVLNDIYKDLRKGKLMNRMVEGDVGSGKTIIAIICSFLFVLNGLQVAYMAPTEILAKQHYENYKKLFNPFGIKVALLTGSQSLKETDQIRESLRKGEIQVVIGTHSLIQDKTDFYNLGLIITDEQHRFGVKQRGLFKQKGAPHTLVMSATPIPRTLALTLYGDLDLSVIKEAPKGRKKVFTYFYTFKKIPKILEFIEKEIKNGHQAFIVCPFVEDSEEMPDVISVQRTYEMVKDYFGDRIKVEMLHGKMSPEEKEKKIENFNTNKTDLLVSTSIIEVGIDVPNVSVIAILNSDRFGLSQLHQLRGRTGRSNIQSYCFLVSDNKSEQTIERMRTIVSCHDGHEIAKADLKMRGPGDYFGYRQHGFGNIKMIDPIKDKKIFEETNQLIREIFSSKKAEDIILKDYLINAFYEDTKFITMN